MVTYMAYRIYKKNKTRYSPLSLFSPSICADIVLLLVLSFVLGIWR